MTQIKVTLPEKPKPKFSMTYVLVGEYAGDYDDFYQRFREPIAASSSKPDLEKYRDELTDHEYVEFSIEEIRWMDLHIHPTAVGPTGPPIPTESGHKHEASSAVNQPYLRETGDIMGSGKA